MSETIGAVPDLPLLPAQSQEQFLALFQRLLPAHYLTPLQEPGPGYEVLEAYAAIGERLSTAVAHVANGNYIATAQGGSYSTGQVQFYRDTTIYGGFTMLAGTVVGTASGYEYTTTQAVTIADDATESVSVPVRATVRSWLYDQAAPLVRDGAVIVPGLVDRLVRPELRSTSNFDPTIKVRQLTAITGGAPPMLDGLGYDRGLVRGVGESDEDYRLRMALMVDTVTITALQRLLKQTVGPVLDPLGLHYWIFEAWDLRVETCWDAPINQTWTASEEHCPVPAFNANIFVWDYEPITPVNQTVWGAWTNRMLNKSDYRRALLVGLPYRPEFDGLFAGVAQNLLQAKPAGVPIYFLEA